MYRPNSYLAEMKAVFKLNGKESYEAITAPKKNVGGSIRFCLQVAASLKFLIFM